MHTFLTPEPITCEIRNAAGEIAIELADVTTTTVEVILSANPAFGFLDDMFKAVNRWGNKPGANSAESPFDEDPTEKIKVEFQPAPDGGDANERGVLILDTDPARGMMRNAFIIRITAPRNSSVRARTESADVGITGSIDRLEVKSASGNVNVSEVTGRAVIQTASGDVTLPQVRGDLDLRVVSGNAEIGAVGGRAVIASTSGDVRLDTAAADVDIRTVSGAVEVRDVRTGSTEVSGISGNVWIGVHPGSAAHIDLNTMTGKAASDFDVADQLDGASLTIKAKTVSGDIRLRSAVSI